MLEFQHKDRFLLTNGQIPKFSKFRILRILGIPVIVMGEEITYSYGDKNHRGALETILKKVGIQKIHGNSQNSQDSKASESWEFWEFCQSSNTSSMKASKGTPNAYRRRSSLSSLGRF